MVSLIPDADRYISNLAQLVSAESKGKLLRANLTPHLGGAYDDYLLVDNVLKDNMRKIVLVRAEQSVIFEVSCRQNDSLLHEGLFSFGVFRYDIDGVSTLGALPLYLGDYGFAKYKKQLKEHNLW